jgi:hemerythrin superfamily protein
MTQAKKDVITLVQEDHQEIKTLMNDLSTAQSGRADIFERLIAKLAMHETAEEEVVHPLVRRAAGGDAVADELLAEEDKGKKALYELEKIGPDAPGFAAKFEPVRGDVLAHATHEEQSEHPKIRAAIDPEQLQRAGSVFEVAENIGPTHAHKHAPESATGNIFVGTFVAVADRVRDALRHAMGTSKR